MQILNLSNLLWGVALGIAINSGGLSSALKLTSVPQLNESQKKKEALEQIKKLHPETMSSLSDSLKDLKKELEELQEKNKVFKQIKKLNPKTRSILSDSLKDLKKELKELPDKKKVFEKIKEFHPHTEYLRYNVNWSLGYLNERLNEFEERKKVLEEIEVSFPTINLTKELQEGVARSPYFLEDLKKELQECPDTWPELLRFLKKAEFKKRLQELLKKRDVLRRELQEGKDVLEKIKIVAGDDIFRIKKNHMSGEMGRWMRKNGGSIWQEDPEKWSLQNLKNELGKLSTTKKLLLQVKESIPDIRLSMACPNVILETILKELPDRKKVLEQIKKFNAIASYSRICDLSWSLESMKKWRCTLGQRFPNVGTGSKGESCD